MKPLPFYRLWRRAFLLTCMPNGVPLVAAGELDDEGNMMRPAR